MASDDEDDTHYCIKCHATILGLDNYVTHRKAKCHPEREKRAEDFFSSLNLQSSSKSIWNSNVSVDVLDDQFEDRRGMPPSDYTGGKWKPESTEQSAHQVNSHVPPPDHTRGKWGPDARPWGSLNKRYWCGPCNRKLSSRVVYDRHIKSELHFKRTNQWPRQQEELPTARSCRTRLRTKSILASSLKSNNKRYKREIQQQMELKRKKRGGTTVCEACGCKVWPHLMGKHLVSFYHYRHRRPGMESLVLRNIEAVVKQSPFQCGLCNFYTNTVSDFTDHWSSDMHRENDQKFEGIYWCCLCKHSTENSVAMEFHMSSEAHQEMVLVLNRSIPVIIQKRVPLVCEVCSRNFRYNIELKAHIRKCNHVHTKSTASSSYQETTTCEDCNFHCNSLLSYQRHLRMKHGKEINFCRRCDVRFDTAEEAKKHRGEIEHRDAACKSDKRCPHCFIVVSGIAAMKEHVMHKHPDRNHSCIRCGAKFLLSQELSQHVKSKDCVPINVELSLKCLQCRYTTDSESDLLLHNILHGEPDQDQKYTCLECNKLFKKEGLRNHVKVHTNERNFVCNTCGACFNRRDVLSKHTAKVHGLTHLPSKRLGRHMVINHERIKKFPCSECSSAFYDKASLEMHSQRHKGKKYPCQEEGCFFKGRSEAELKSHLATHGAERNFHCDQCQYSAKTRGQLLKHIKSQHTQAGMLLSCPHCDFTTKNKTHLRRHANLHSGQKPFKCPHCNFSCSLLENLRKHVIISSLHPGKTLYECPYCDGLQTNFSKELKTHLVTNHGRSSSEASSHISGLLQEMETSNPHMLVPVNPNKRKKIPMIVSELEVEEQLPTLASVALTTHEEDVIFVTEVLEGVLSAEVLESYTTEIINAEETDNV